MTNMLKVRDSFQTTDCVNHGAVNRDARLFFFNPSTFGFIPEEDKIKRRSDRLNDTILGVRATYSYILGEGGVSITKTKEFKNLHGVAHFGSKYPSHSRAEHSLNAACISNSLLINEPKLPYSRSAIILAALLHDIGHYAFSHTAEMINHDLFDHKERGKSIILDSPVTKIIESTGVSPEEVAEIALEKNPGNPFSMQRSKGFISLDHLANLTGNIYYSNNENTPEINEKEIWAVLERMYISREGLLSLGKNSIGLAQKMTRLSIADNIHNIFPPRAIALDMVVTNFMRDLMSEGILEADDFTHTDNHILFKILKAFTEGRISQDIEQKIIAWRALNDKNLVSDERVNDLITRIDKRDKLKKAKNHILRSVKDHYILEPAIDGEKPSDNDESLKQEIKKAEERIIGDYGIAFSQLEQFVEDSKRKAAKLVKMQKKV